ncbi:MAG: AMP-binding protein [Planctomycetota bacterium]
MHIWTLLERAAALWGDRPAVFDGGAVATYADVHRRAGALAAAWRAQGLGPGTRIAILDDNRGAFLEAYFAAAAAEVILCPLNTRLADAEVAAVLADAGAALLLVRAEHSDKVAHLGVRTQALDAPLANPTAAAPPGRRAADDVAHLYYTSGTTGAPKGVMLTHRNVCTHALAAIAELGLSDADTWGHFAPMFHLADAWATFAVTWVGGRHVMLPRFDAETALQSIATHRVTTTNLVPTMLGAMLAARSDAHDTSSLRLLLSGGAPIAPDVVRRVVNAFGCEYVQTYGMTETSPYLTLSSLKAHHRALPLADQINIRAKTGRPFLTVELQVVDEAGAPVPQDAATVGEIRVRGPTVTTGYWRRPDATAAAFDNHGYLRTGDLAVIDAEGYLTIVDRKKDVIITGGENVYSTDVERVLYRHPAVLEAAVFGVPDPTWGEAVQAAVALRSDATATAAELTALCREHLAGFKVPRTVHFLDALPRTGSGKLSKRALRERFGGTA